MLHTVKTTCAISALLVSFAATAHAANVVSDPYASYIDCSKGQAQNSGNSGCTIRGQQVTVSALSQMMAAANANVANLKANTAISNYSYNLRPTGNERNNVQYERGTERGLDGKDREVKQLVFLVDPRPRGKDGVDAPGGNVNERGGRDAAGRTVSDRDVRDANGRLIKDGRGRPTASSSTASSEGVGRVYKIELTDAAAAQIEKYKRERDGGVSPSSRPSSDGGIKTKGTWDNTAEAWDDDGDENGMDVVIPLQYASEDEIKAEEAKLAQAAPAAATPGSSGPVAPVTATPALASPGNANQSGESAPLKVMILKDSQSSDGTTATLRISSATTAEVIYAATIRTDALVAYRVREAAPVTQNLAQGESATPGQNVRDQSYSGMNNTPLGSGGSAGNQSEPMDRDNPDSGRGGAGT